MRRKELFMSDETRLTDTNSGTRVSRRDFMKLGGLAAATPVVVNATTVSIAGEDVPVYGPGKVPVKLNVNGQVMSAEVEPRTTLLDALRENFDLTGAKRVCDRGVCGACTVTMDGKPVYACSVLAVDAQPYKIQTVESLGEPGKLSPVQQAFVDNDAQQCGFCTSGFVVATTAFLEKHPHPTNEEIRTGLSGNLCRCGTYAGIQKAIHQVASGDAAGKRG